MYQLFLLCLLHHTSALPKTYIVTAKDKNNENQCDGKIKAHSDYADDGPTLAGTDNIVKPNMTQDQTQENKNNENTTILLPRKIIFVFT